jgi:hypothetical protein
MPDVPWRWDPRKRMRRDRAEAPPEDLDPGVDRGVLRRGTSDRQFVAA